MRADHLYVLREIVVLDEAARLSLAQPASGAWPEGRVKQVLTMLARQFETHMAAEDELLFPALVETLPQIVASIEPLRADHATLRAMLHSLGELVSTPPSSTRDEQIGIQLRDFVDLLRIHIRKEEAVAISVAERVLRPSELEAFAVRMLSGSSGHGPTGPGATDKKGDRA
jgi:hemerythrin-like domain-containing protein